MSNLIEVIKKAAMDAFAESKPVEIIYGTVIAINPLKIDIDQKQPLDQDFLLLTRNVTDYKTQISFDNASVKNQIEITGGAITGTLTTDEGVKPAQLDGNATGQMSFATKTKHDVSVYNALKAGEKVILIRVQGGQKFLVLDRAVEI